MKLGADQFRLEAPQLSPEKLAIPFAQQAINCRVLSGALEPWKQDTEQTGEPVTKEGTIRSIHLMDIDGSDGGPYLLHWPFHVDVAKGPIGGDTTERTYFTGAGSPKMTNLALATSETEPPAKLDEDGYPYRWENLGVPSPGDAPVASVTPPDAVAENEIELTNPDAESSTTGWTNVSGEMIASTTQAYDGTHSFASNDAGGTEEYQELDLATEGILAGQRLRVTARHRAASGGGGADRSRIRIEAWDGGGMMDAAIGPWITSDTDWVLASADLVVPDDAVVIRIYQQFEGAVDAAWIDDIHLYVMSSSFYSSGTSLSDWLSSGGGAVISANESAWGRDGLFKFRSGGAQTGAIYRNFGSENSPSYKVQFEYTADKRVYLAVVLDADAAGNGWQIKFAQDGVYLEQTASWGSTFSSTTKLADGTFIKAPSQFWWRGTITVTKAGTKKNVRIDAVRLDNNDALATNVTASFTPQGSYLGFKAWDEGDTNDGFLDEIYINVEPAPTGGSGGSGGGNGDTLADYVYTLGSTASGALAMSGPSPASNEVAIGAAPSVFVTTSTTPPADYDASVKYIWRRVTGSDGSTTYRLVRPAAYPSGEIPLAVETINDTNTDAQLGDEIPDVVGFEVAPPDAHSIVAGANGITYLASKNQVFASPVNQPHAYPPLWAKPTDYPIVALAALAADVYALTQAHPYVITGSDPSALDMEKLSRPIGCASKRSVAVDRRLGVVYAAADGLAYANKADNGLLTDGILTEREWQTFDPENITGCIYDGNYIGFNTTFGFFIDLTGQTGIGRLNFVATALFLNPITGNLHMIVDGVHVTFNSAAAVRTFTWHGRDFMLDRPASFQFLRVELDESESGNVTVDLFYDDVLVHTETVSTSDEVLLPDDDASHLVSIRLSGARKVKRVAIVEDIEEMAR
jgi:hypothetical protein